MTRPAASFVGQRATMPRTYALKRLLEHGAMGLTDIVECTGWPFWVANKALQQCLCTGVVRRVPSGSRYAYEAAT